MADNMDQCEDFAGTTTVETDDEQLLPKRPKKKKKIDSFTSDFGK